MFFNFIFFGFVSSYLFLWFLIPILRKLLLDIPNVRSSHYYPIPRGGGLSFVILSVLSSVLSFIGSIPSTLAFLPLIAFPLSLVGLIDDRSGLPISARYFSQFLTSVFLVLLSPFIEPLYVYFNCNFFPIICFILFSSFFITSIINFTNFMDGLDGLVAGCMAISIVSCAIHLSAPWPLWFFVGALIGFLPWNWNPAKVFMGDVGSTFLGAVFAGLLFQSQNLLDAVSLLLVSTPMIGDAFSCLLRRFFAGHSVVQPHKLHLYQRLHQAGWSHSFVSFIYIGASAVLAIALFIGGFPWLLPLVIIELLFGFLLDRFKAVPFVHSSSS